MRKRICLFLTLTLAMIITHHAQASNLAYTIQEKLVLVNGAADPLGLGSNTATAVINFSLDSTQLPIQTRSYSDPVNAVYAMYNVEGTSITLTGTQFDGTYIYPSSSYITNENYFTNSNQSFERFRIDSNFQLPDAQTYTFSSVLSLPLSFWGDSEIPPLPKPVNQENILSNSGGAIWLPPPSPRPLSYITTGITINTSKTYGLFIGSREINNDLDWRCDISATLMSNLFKQDNGIIYNQQIVAVPGITKDSIKSQLDYIKNNTRPGDTLFLYINGHGGLTNNLLGLPEGDVQIQLGLSNYTLKGSELCEYLSGMDSIKKNIIIDGCYSGAFCNKLASLNNISLLASTQPYSIGKAITITQKFIDANNSLEFINKYPDFFKVGYGYGILSLILFEGLTYTDNHFEADTGKDGLSMKDLADWAKTRIMSDDWQKYINNFNYFESEFGDQTTFSLDEWNPFANQTADFVDSPIPFNESQVPLPPSVWLLGSGLVCLIGLRRFRKN